MSEEFIKNLLGNINYEVETDTNWVEPLGFGRDTWKALLKYIQQKENIIKEVREFAKLRKEMCERQENVVGQEVIISLLNILDKGE